MNSRRASATAKLIAAATVMRERQRVRGGAGPVDAAAWCQRLLSTSRSDRLLLWSGQAAVGRAWWRLAEAATIPGVVSHWMRRKREIDRVAREAAAEGFSQLVVLGAGLDALALRMHAERLFAAVVSADHPATLAVVRAALDWSAAGWQPRADAAAMRGARGGEVELCDLDLEVDDAGDAFATARSFDPARATLVVIEGVLMYLPEAAVTRLLRALAALPMPRVRLIASSMIAAPGEPIGFRRQSRWVSRWLRRRSEPMLWACTRAALPPLLLECGWSDAQVADLTSEDPPGSPLSRGLASEVLVVAERVDSWFGR